MSFLFLSSLLFSLSCMFIPRQHRRNTWIQISIFLNLCCMFCNSCCLGQDTADKENFNLSKAFHLKWDYNVKLPSIWSLLEVRSTFCCIFAITTVVFSVSTRCLEIVCIFTEALLLAELHHTYTQTHKQLIKDWVSPKTQDTSWAMLCLLAALKVMRDVSATLLMLHIVTHC